MVKIGIEIHQRLNTNKLFCDCPSSLDENAQPIATAMRRLHPVLSELGEIDEASRAEYGKGREFEYRIFSNNCLVEIDEEPPHQMNEQALRIALSIANQLHATPVDESCTMRKMVIDGSTTSGFQRTAIIALNGHLETSKGIVRITTIALEEESAGIVSANETKAVYRLDRLGIPLIEISTAPDIKDGEHLQEVAEKIGLILRTNGNVARGLGTIRQDINVSTEGGTRVEIKGAQDLKMLSAIAQGEIRRQTELVKIIFELRRLMALPITLDIYDLTDIFESTSAPMIKNSIANGGRVLAQKLQNHTGILGREIQKGKRYGTELSDYAKLAGVKGIIHSDEALEKYEITNNELEKVRKRIKEFKLTPTLTPTDAFVLVVAPKDQAEKALKNVLIRANIDYVPGETRKANPDGTTTFMRPIPGRARMYPETDILPVSITTEMVNALNQAENLESRKARLEKLLNKGMATIMLKSKNLHLFEKLVELGIEPMLAANTLENTVVALRREGFEINDIEKTMLELFSEFKKGSFVKAAIPDILKYMAKGARVDAVLKVYRLQKITGKELEKLVFENSCNMQVIMQKFRLQVDSSEVAEIIKKQKCEDPAYR